MKKLCILVISFFSIFLPVCPANAGETKSALSGKLVIPGTGDSQNLPRALAESFERKHPGVIIEIPDSIGSSGGIRAAGKDEVNLARVARPIKEKEKKYGLNYKVFAKSPVVFVVNPNVEIDNLTFDQINGIYSGKITLWEQVGGSASKIYPVTREFGDSGRTIVNRGIPGFKGIKKHAAKIYYTTPEAVDAVASHKNTIGYSPMGMIKKTGLKILKINGIYPTEENIKNERYKLIGKFGIVYKGELNPLAQAFVGFLYTAKGREIIKANGNVPVSE